ncbi:hypothetical protein [Bradyrhizobium tropiciagri]|uniref:hypothetical protein n=1 Tax=Bradyrhizobium tropiciagri TaxID=312253 RepID=UPI00067C448A|nr:hypothetical protein [Bradyrhizobium tropiciagri]
MTDLFELMKIIGSVSGICSAIFLVADRYFKHYPTAIMVAGPLIEGSSNITHFLWLKNYSERPIIVSWQHESNHLHLAKDDSARSIMHSVLPGESAVSLGPNAETQLRVIKPSNHDSIDPDNSLELRLRWRFAQPIIWKADRTIRIWMRKRDFDDMTENYVKAQAV